MRSTSTSRCSSPMPAMIVWPVSSSVWTVKVGSSSDERGEGLAHLVLVGLGLRLDGDVDDRLGELHLLEHDGGLVVGERVAGAGVLQADAGDDVAGPGDVEVLPVVGVHEEDAADPLLLAGAGVEHRAALLELARVDPEVGELAVGIGDDLEGEGGEGLVDVGLALELLLALRVHAVGGRQVERRRHVVDDGVEQGLDALVLERRAGEHRHEAVVDGGVADGALEVLGGDASSRPRGTSPARCRRGG